MDTSTGEIIETGRNTATAFGSLMKPPPLDNPHAAAPSHSRPTEALDDAKAQVTRERQADLQQVTGYLPDIRRCLPVAPDAERGVLSSFLLAPRTIGQLCAEKRITNEHFHLPAHAMIYGTLMEFWLENEPIDFISLTQWMRDKGTLDHVGGAAGITELFTFLPTAANAAYYIEILQEKFILRRIIMVCTEYAARSYDEQNEVPELLFGVQREIQKIGANEAKQRQPFKTLLMEVVKRIETGENSHADLLSGIWHLDELVKMRRGDFIVIGGQAKSGKTALAGTIVTNAIVSQQQRVVLVSLEMNVAEMVKRMLAAAGNVNIARVGQPPTDAEFAGILRGATALGRADVELVDDCYDLSQIIAQCRTIHFQKPIDLIVVDYLQLVESTTGRKGETRQEIVAQISRSCKKLARDLNCVLIGLSQLNEDGKVRESRAISQDANAVISVDEDKEGGRTIRVVAQRNGESNIEVKAKWLPYFTKFDNPPEDAEPDLVHMNNSKPKKARK